MGVVLCILDGFTDPEFDPADYPALSGLRRLRDVDTALGEKPESQNCILHLLGVRSVPPFPEKGCVISGTSVVRGIGKLLGMDVWTVPGATGDTDTDLSAKCLAALDAAGKYPFVLLHINGADEASHRKDAREKHAFLAKVDIEIIRPLAAKLPYFVVTGDHAADPRTGNHAGTPQPVFINRFT